jgi:4-hydroxy-tetrahydrodipicolinate synthase
MTTKINTSEDLQGVYPALFTPLLHDDPNCLRNSIDYDKAKMMIDDLIAAGAHGVVPVGTTGQSATLSTEQHLDFIRFTIEYVAGRVKIIAGAGSNCTRESVEIINNVQKIADVPVLCATGYYNNPEQTGVLRHFQALNRETGAKIILYNVPGRTNTYMTPETIIELAQESNIIGLKQAVNFKVGGEFREDTQKIIAQTQTLNFSVLTGEDDSLADILEIGGKGMISATANIPEAAEMYVKIFHEALAGNNNKAHELQIQVLDFVEACFCRKNPIPLATFFNSPMFLPMVNVIDTVDGQAAHDAILKLIAEKCPSLQKYQ